MLYLFQWRITSDSYFVYGFWIIIMPVPTFVSITYLLVCNGSTAVVYAAFVKPAETVSTTHPFLSVFVFWKWLALVWTFQIVTAVLSHSRKPKVPLFLPRSWYLTNPVCLCHEWNYICNSLSFIHISIKSLACVSTHCRNFRACVCDPVAEQEVRLSHIMLPDVSRTAILEFGKTSGVKRRDNRRWVVVFDSCNCLWRCCVGKRKF
jgi:hypothetical protein